MTETAANAGPLPFDNSYARLPEHFFARLPPTPVEAPRLIRLNRGLAETLGLDAAFLASPAGTEILAGNRIPDGAEPIAMAYAGHQFGGWVPQLGDGRAILIGEVVGRDGIRRDIHLKGAGRTPFSRNGDGRAALGPVLREYIVSEAMHALGLPTTRALAAIATGEPVIRERYLPGAVLVRVAESHVRVGTFQYFTARGDTEAVKRLADYVIARHYPQAAASDDPYAALLDAVVGRQARLVAGWLLVGFIHGVMNTDNMSVAGETIDYGPCAFMDFYHPHTVYSSIDHMGRYAYGNQPPIAQWNLAQLGQCLLPIMSGTEAEALKRAQAIIDGFANRFETELTAGLQRKLGLDTAKAGDLALGQDLLKRMAENEADFTLTFRGLADVIDPEGGTDGDPRNLFNKPGDFDDWVGFWRARLEEEARSPQELAAALRAANPMFIPRNHQVEAVIRAAEDRDDFAPFEKLLKVLARPFDDQPENRRCALPPRPDEVVHQTFCGT